MPDRKKKAPTNLTTATGEKVSPFGKDGLPFRSARELDVRPGVDLTAIVKSLSHGPEDVGTPARG